ncbi:MAG: RluA family pseudouridine synthase [Gammaproteobacteria bacterium]
MTTAAKEPSKARFVTVSDDESGQRLDNFLVRHLKGVPRPRLYRAIRKGEVRVNKGRIAQTYRLEPGDVVRIPPIAPHSDPRPATTSSYNWTPHILAEDKAFLVIDKPSGWAVHGGSGVRHGLIESLRANLSDRHDLELAHRLDRSTSGVLVVAKKRSALRALHAALREAQVSKEYLLLVKGDWQHGDHLVDVPLDVNQRRGGERTVRVAADGMAAATRFSLCDSWGDVSLIRARPQTGRTHQIRVHAAYLEHPIVGDERYGDRAINQSFKRYGLKRLFLHSASMAFEHPEGFPRHFSAPLSDDLRAVIDQIEKRGRQRTPRAMQRAHRQGKR